MHLTGRVAKHAIAAALGLNISSALGELEACVPVAEKMYTNFIDRAKAFMVAFVP
jgi:hypothetical protein